MLADGVDLGDEVEVRAWMDALIQHTAKPTRLTERPTTSDPAAARPTT